MATITKKKPAAKPAKSAKPSASARPVAKPGRNGSAVKTKSVKRVYFFGNGKAEGNAGMKDQLGGKGANLADMTLVPLPVPPGFTITTETCGEYNDAGQKLPAGSSAMPPTLCSWPPAPAPR